MMKVPDAWYGPSGMEKAEKAVAAAESDVAKERAAVLDR